MDTRARRPSLDGRTGRLEIDRPGPVPGATASHLVPSPARSVSHWIQWRKRDHDLTKGYESLWSYQPPSKAPSKSRTVATRSSSPNQIGRSPSRLRNPKTRWGCRCRAAPLDNGVGGAQISCSPVDPCCRANDPTKGADDADKHHSASPR